MNTPLTLAIPCYNGDRYLEATLASLGHNRPHVRWHLQDACSTDGTLKIAGRHRGGGDTIVSARDNGQADALNRAFTSMGGDIIGFINADDLLADGAAEAVLRHFHEHPETDLVYGEVEWIDAAGTVTGRHSGEINSLEDVLDIYRVWWRKRQWVQPEVFFRRSLWEKVGPFDTRYHLAFDYDFWVRCFLAGARVAKINRVLARFRLHPEQKSSNALEAAHEIRNILERHLAAAPVTAGFRRRLLRMLSFDRYQSGQDFAAAEERPSLARMLFTRPEWLLLPSIRRRLARGLLSRLCKS